MKTEEALTRFLKKCEERGLSQETRRTYKGYLQHFSQENLDLPTETKVIENYLKKHKETPAHRGKNYTLIQAFYSYLEQFEGISSPVPAKGKIGRPRKAAAISGFSMDFETNPENSTLRKNKLIPEDKSVSGSKAISTAKAVRALIEAKKVEGVRPRTLQNYIYYFKPFINKYPFLPVTIDPIVEFLGSIQGEPETRWTYRRHLITLYHFLEGRKWIPKDLFDFPKVKVPRKVRRVLSQEELHHLFPFTKNFQERAILNLLIDAKIRASELLSVTRERTYSDHVVVEAKGGGTRQAPINEETYRELIQIANSGPLFLVNGKPMRREYLRLMLRRLMEDSGLEGKKLGPHILRHSASVQHMIHGGDLKSLQKELGHTTTKMTDVYAELADTDVQKIHAKVNVLGNVTGPSPFERARCYGCQKEIVLELDKVNETKCPGCGQVGKWYLPDERNQGVLA